MKRGFLNPNIVLKLKMISMKSKFIYLFMVLLIMVAACKKNTFNVTDPQSVDGKALVKIGLFNMTTTSTPLLIFANGQRISGALSSPNAFPGGGFNAPSQVSNGDYFAVAPGDNKLEFYTTNFGTANIISKIFETTQNLEANKKYTVYITDTAANIKAIKAPDNANTPDSGLARIRFTNLIPNSGSVDFYKGNTLVKAAVNYKDFTDFIDVPSSIVDTFSIRIAGTPAGPAITSIAYLRMIVNTNQRIYSFVSRGYLGAPEVLRKPNVSAFVNQ